MDGDITSADIEAAMGGDGGATSEPGSEGAATTQPTETDAQLSGAPDGVSVDPSRGEPPADKWPTILDNARKKATDEAWKGYEPLRGVKPEQVNDLVTWWQRAHKDPDAFLTSTVLEHADPMALVERIVQEVQKHPTHGQAFKSFVGRKLAQQRQSQPADEPQFLIPQANGEVAVDMAAFVKWQAWQEQKIRQSLAGEIQPLKARLDAEDKRIAAAEQARAVDEFADATSTDALTWPGMDDDATRAEVAAEYWRRVEHKTLSNDQLLVELNAAWRSVALPKMSQRERAKTLHDINRTASAGTINPGRTSTGAPKSVDQMSLREAIEAALAG